MEYFRIRQDQRISCGILFSGLNKYLSYQDICGGNITGLDYMTPMIISSSKFNEYPDVLSRQIFVVRQPVKEAFDMFAPEIAYRVLCCMDLPNQMRTYYYAPQFPSVDCYSVQSDANLDRSVIHKAVLKRELLGEYDIFRVSGVAEHLVIVSLAVAECILRRKLNGVQLTRVCFAPKQTC